MQKLTKDLFKYSALNMAAMVGVSFYILADTFFIAKALGATGLAALNFCIVIFMFIQGAGLMAGIGGAIDFSIRKVGKKEKEKSSFTNALVLGAFFSLVFIIIGVLFLKPLVGILGAMGEVVEPTKIYLITILSFSPFFIMNNIMLAFVRNDQAPRLAMMAMVISSVSNVILDYFFIFPLSMGIFGAALATCFSPIISLGILMFHLRFRKVGFGILWNDFKIQKVFRIAKLGTSSFIGEMASGITLFAFNLVLLKIAGTIGVAAYGIIANVAIVVTALLTGLAQGVQPLASRSYGKGDIKALNQTKGFSLISSIMLSTFLYGIIFLFTSEIVAVFNEENNVRLAEIAEKGMALYFSGFIFGGINIVRISIFSSAAQAGKALVISILRSSLILIPAVVTLSFFLGLTGTWISLLITEIIVVVISLCFHKRIV